MTKPLISLIITSFNDRAIIRPLYKAIVATLNSQTRYDWEIIYVDDGSTDGSAEELRQLSQEDPKVTFIELSRNFGQQKAVFTGMKQSRGDVVITLDGDYQYPPDCILPLANKVLSGFDIVGGVRIHRKDPWFSRFTSWIGKYFIRRALKVSVADFGSIRAFSRFLIQQIIKYDTYCLSVHGISYALTNRYAELPIPHLPRPVGRSKWTLLKRVHLLFDIYLGFSDIHLIGLTKLGALIAIIGFLAVLISLYLYHAYHFIFFHTFTALSVMGAGCFLILGSFGLSFLLRIYRMLLWKGDVTVIRQIYNSTRKD